MQSKIEKARKQWVVCSDESLSDLESQPDAKNLRSVENPNRLGVKDGWLATLQPDATFHVTGKTTDGRRFKTVTQNAIQAFGINLWRGSVWGVNADGSRTLLRRVHNV